jgi:hypothetical protein
LELIVQPGPERRPAPIDQLFSAAALPPRALSLLLKYSPAMFFAHFIGDAGPR